MSSDAAAAADAAELVAAALQTRKTTAYVRVL